MIFLNQFLSLGIHCTVLALKTAQSKWLAAKMCGREKSHTVQRPCALFRMARPCPDVFRRISITMAVQTMTECQLTLVLSKWHVSCIVTYVKTCGRRDCEYRNWYVRRAQIVTVRRFAMAIGYTFISLFSHFWNESDSDFDEVWQVLWPCS